MSASFHNLSNALQRSIDEAFDLVAEPTDDSSFIGGGFIIDEPPRNHIPLSSVPQALSYLNLPPDDEQVLAVFRNAASGWSSATNTVDERRLSNVVSRDDWRSVCAVLLEQSDGNSSDHSIDVESQGDDNDYDEHQSLDSSQDSRDSSEYEEPAEKSIRQRKHGSHSSAGTSQQQHALSKKQRDACLEAYSLFFPGMPLEDAPTQRITAQEVQQVASTLGEKLTTAEINEMLEMFSSSPDKSMAFSDFSRMMIKAKLV